MPGPHMPERTGITHLTVGNPPPLPLQILSEICGNMRHAHPIWRVAHPMYPGFQQYR
jgi:hypothetical protein